MYDYLIKNAIIVDGQLNKPYKGNLAIYGNIIAFISDTLQPKSRKVIDGEGCYLAPGFIDIHAHSELYMLKEKTVKAKLGQGITTDCSGNCGIGVFPINERAQSIKALASEVLGEYPDWSWRGIQSFKEKLLGNIGINAMFLQAHAPLRAYAMEDPNREATQDEIDKMCALLDESLQNGTIGFSTGLYYSPCLFASKEELLALLKVVKKHNALFAVHHRTEGDDIVQSIEEVINLAKESGVKLQISHLKTIGKRNVDKLKTVLTLIEDAKKDGVDIAFDCYPYSYGSTSLFSLLPPDIQRLSRLEQRFALSLENECEDIAKEIENPKGWDSIYSLVGPDDISICELSQSSEYNGMTLSELGNKLNLPPLKALFTVLSEEAGLALMFDKTESDDNLRTIIKHPLSSFGTDSLYSSLSPHPRSFSSSVELLSRFVRDEKLLAIEEAINKMTLKNAERLALKDRGIIEEGKIADLVLFNLNELETKADDSVKKGIKAVFVNGKLSVYDGQVLDVLGGEVL